MHIAGLRVRFLALFAAAAATLVFAASASAATKPYSLVICALGSSETCAPSQTLPAPLNQPAGVPAGATGVSMTAAFLNENKVGTGLNLGSSNLTAPSGFTVNSASVGGSALPACSASTPATTSCLNGNTVELRSLGLIPGAALTLAMTVTPPTTLTACTVASPCVWTVSSKQSNDFSGTPGNDLNVDANTSTLNTVLAQLQFAPSSEPHNTRLGQAITDSDYNPPPPAGTGGPVIVEVADANGTPVSSYDGAVTLTLTTPNNPFTNPNPATLSGTNPLNASAGVARFSDLTVNDPGNGFTLTASTPASDMLTSTTSTLFNVQQAAALCAEKKSCSAEATSTNSGVTDGGIDVTVSSASGDTSELAESIDFGNWPSATRINECGHASANFAYQAFSTQRSITSTITTTDLELTKKNLSASISAQDICLAETEPFMAKDESTNPVSLVPAQAVTLPDGSTGFAGLEPDCGKKSNQVLLGTGPCVTARSGTLNSSGAGGTLTISDSSPNDRWVN